VSLLTTFEKIGIFETASAVSKISFSLISNHCNQVKFV